MKLLLHLILTVVPDGTDSPGCSSENPKRSVHLPNWGWCGNMQRLLENLVAETTNGTFVDEDVSFETVMVQLLCILRSALLK